MFKVYNGGASVRSRFSRAASVGRAMSFECCPGMRLFSRIVCAVLLAAGVAWFLTIGSAADDGPRTFDLSDGSSETARFAVESAQAYGLLVSVPDISAFAEKDALKITYRDPAGREITKQLHAGDGDLYAMVRPEEAGTSTVVLEGTRIGGGRSIQLEAELKAIPGSAVAGADLGIATHTAWRDAQPIELGSTIYASADDRPYIPTLGAARGKFEQMLAGIHWYKFQHKGPAEKLVHINVEMLDRDVPVDVALFTVKDGEPVEYTRGIERFEPEKSTILHGLYKFQARAITSGTYYLRVMGNHPAYQLQTELYDVPPYDNAQKAIRVAMDYIVRKGDSWHANVPRRGVVALRTTNPVQETRLCIACHPTHFSTRSEMIAVENGYPVRARPSLQFLIERLSNNPRPLYGKTDASWARMIHAPGNVLSRLAYIVDKFDKQISGERREELYRGIREFMELYWPGVATPQPESNGNLPRISGYEVAHHSGVLFEHYYKATGDSKYKALREQTERTALAGESADMLDLCWQTVALAELGGEKYRDKIGENVERIFSHQKRDGSWAMPFAMEIVEYDWSKHTVRTKKIPPRPGEDGPRTSEFQTYHAIYALAKAGVTLDDPRLQKAVRFCLAQQTPSGAWQGSPEYKNFDTPFRDTQYAIMALSELFPGPNAGGKKGWNAGFPEPPSEFDKRDVMATLKGLDHHWDRPSDETAAAIRELLNSEHVLVRFQAAVALGRFADVASIGTLAELLGDRSKVVQRAAAWSLRQIGSRRPEVRAQFAAAVRRAMRSSDARVRWGAARIFNQHFKYISEEWKLGRELVRMAWHEPVPAVQMQALQGLYQWWFWDRDVEHKKEIEIALANGLGRENHPWVRRNFIEAYYNTLDDNLRYLYKSWMVRVKNDEDREAIGTAHKQNVREQATRFRDAMIRGNERTRDGLLRVFFTHVLREGLGDVDSLAGAALPETVAGPWVNGYKWFAIHDPLTSGTGRRAKTGNDSDPPTFYEDSSPLMNEALLTTLSAETPELAEATLRAMRFLKPFRIEVNLADRMLELVSKPSLVRESVAKEAKSFLPAASLDDPTIVARLAGMLRAGDPVSIDVASAILTHGKQKSLASNAELQDAVAAAFEQVSTAEGRRFGSLADLLAVMPDLHRNETILERVATGFDGEEDAQAASLRFVLGAPETMKFVALRRAYDRRFAQASPAELGAALELVGRLDYKGDRYGAAMDEIRELVLKGMKHNSPKLRAATLTSVRTVEPLQDDGEVREELRKLLTDADVEVRNSALAFKASLDARAGREGYDTRQLLDYEYFKVHVQPILANKGADGLACVNCHANHTIFKLNEPDEFGVLDEAKIRGNYASAIGVVNVVNPEGSLLLNKPTSDEDAAGIGNSQRFSHGGDLRWPERANSREYRTILRWIQGERLGSAQAAGGE